MEGGRWLTVKVSAKSALAVAVPVAACALSPPALMPESLCGKRTQSDRLPLRNDHQNEHICLSRLPSERMLKD